MITYWPSPAKLNLFLYITGQRIDGYHTLQTLFQFIDYEDTLSIKVRQDGKINLLTSVNGIPKENNLIIRAARLLQKNKVKDKNFSNGNGADIMIKKLLPIGGGLGGGSSNAATTLVALNYLWKCGFSQEKLAELGLRLGSDIPFFIYGHSAFAEGIGEILTPVKLEEKWYLIANPNTKVLSEAIFKDPDLPRNSPIRSMDMLLKHKFTNNCEVVVRKRFCEIDTVISWLSKYSPARLTGTGSCVFAEFNTESAARRVLKLSPQWINGFVARGMNVSSLRLTMLVLD